MWLSLFFKVDLLSYPCLVFKNKVIIRPHATEEIKVLFIPSDPGIFRCIFSVASWPFTADAETAVQAEALASRVILTAIAETPVIEVTICKWVFVIPVVLMKAVYPEK